VIARIDLFDGVPNLPATELDLSPKGFRLAIVINTSNINKIQTTEKSMNATQTKQKQIGDQVRITAGQFKDQIGQISGKERRGWTITLEDGTQATVPFPMVVLIVADTAEPTDVATIESTEEADSSATVEDNVADEPVAQPELTEQTQPKRSRRKTARSASDGSGENGETTTEVSQMTVRELWALAKTRGVSVARTKADFYRIIKAMNPDEDLALLKGKALFDRVKELHISRLRSKEEMATLLSI